MRLRRYYWPERVAVYFLIIFLLTFSFPRPSYAVLPLLLAAVPLTTSAVAEVMAVSTAATVATGVVTTVVLGETIRGMNNELDRATFAESVGNNLRAEGRIPAVGATAVAMGIVNPSAFNTETYQGKIVNVTSPAELAALSPKISGADALYGVPSKVNPVPVLIPPLRPDYYPSVAPGAVLSPSPSGVYNMSASGFDNSFNPHEYRYATADTADDLLDLYIAGHQEVINDYQNRAISAYNYFLRICDLCINGGERYANGGTEVLTPLHVDEFTSPDLIKSVTHSTARGRYNVNGAIVSLPYISSIQASVSPLIFNNQYRVDLYVRGELRSSVIKNNQYEFQGRIISSSDVSPSSSLMVKENTTGMGAVVTPPLHTQPEVMAELGRVPLTASQVASMINSAWAAASVRPGYAGLPYSPSVAISSATVAEVMQARNIQLSVAELLEPVSETGYWDLPVYNITLNQYVSNTYIEQVPELDLGADPKTQAPALSSPLPIETILAPVTNILPFMHDITLHSRAAQCPVYELNIDYLGKRYILDSHCRIMNNFAPIVSLFFMIGWTMLSLFIVVRRRR